MPPGRVYFPPASPARHYWLHRTARTGSLHPKRPQSHPTHPRGADGGHRYGPGLRDPTRSRAGLSHPDRSLLHSQPRGHSSAGCGDLGTSRRGQWGNHGFPARLVVSGCLGAASIKWLGRIEVSEDPLYVPWNTEDYVLIGPDFPAYEPAHTRVHVVE
ncbi:MAG TPA: molybdopterin-dependent oxidoreductase [Pseudonocardiaceae bacterium]